MKNRSKLLNYKLSFDGDFQTKLRNAGYNGTPREEVTIIDAIRMYNFIEKMTNIV